MTPQRDRFIGLQSNLLDELFALAPGEDQTRRHFEEMAIETYGCLVAQDFTHVSPFKLETESAFNFLRYGEKARSLVARRPPAEVAGLGTRLPETARTQSAAGAPRYAPLHQRKP